MTSSRFFKTCAILCLALAPSVASSGDTLTLKLIMQGLRDDLVRISDGLLTDDFELIVKGARGIAEHPRIPPDQVQLVAAELGAEMPAFKQLDMLVHDMSMAIKVAAEASDRDNTLQSFQEITEGCIACHDAYKERVAKVLAADQS